jgi:hypothetical protein
MPILIIVIQRYDLSEYNNLIFSGQRGNKEMGCMGCE